MKQASTGICSGRAEMLRTAARETDIYTESERGEIDGCCGQKTEGSLELWPVHLETRGRGMLLRKNDDSAPLAACMPTSGPFGEGRKRTGSESWLLLGVLTSWEFP